MLRRREHKLVKPKAASAEEAHQMTIGPNNVNFNKNDARNSVFIIKNNNSNNKMDDWDIAITKFYRMGCCYGFEESA